MLCQGLDGGLSDIWASYPPVVFHEERLGLEDLVVRTRRPVIAVVAGSLEVALQPIADEGAGCRVDAYPNSPNVRAEVRCANTEASLGALLVRDREYGTAVTGQAREHNLGRAHHHRRTVGVACDTIATPLVRSKVSPRRCPARAPGWRTDPRCGAGGRPIPRQQNSSYVEFTA